MRPPHPLCSYTVRCNTPCEIAVIQQEEIKMLCQANKIFLANVRGLTVVRTTRCAPHACSARRRIDLACPAFAFSTVQASQICRGEGSAMPCERESIRNRTYS